MHGRKVVKTSLRGGCTNFSHIQGNIGIKTMSQHFFRS